MDRWIDRWRTTPTTHHPNHQTQALLTAPAHTHTNLPHPHAPPTPPPSQGKYHVDHSQDMDGVRLQKLLAGMRDRAATAAVVEVSTEALARGWMEVRGWGWGVGVGGW